MANNEILFLEAHNKPYIWGCENWTISAHTHGDTKVSKGSLESFKLSQIWQQYPKLFGRKSKPALFNDFPLLVKIISANDDLSIQVHPDNDYANKNENGSLGKTECWYILDCDENAALILGHSANDKHEIKDMADNNRLIRLIREVPIKKGDFIQINPGTIHTIKKGITLLEIQQSSDITYRLYDYGRLDDSGIPRPLHIKQAIDVIECPSPEVSDCIIRKRNIADNEMNELYNCECYTVWEMNVNDKAKISQDYPFLIICVIGGTGFINGIKIKAEDHFILPFEYGEAVFTGKMNLILTAVP